MSGLFPPKFTLSGFEGSLSWNIAGTTYYIETDNQGIVINMQSF